MTLETKIARIVHAGNGTPNYSYPFRLDFDTDVKVIHVSAAGNETVLTLTTDYSVTDVGDDSGGNVVMEPPYDALAGSETVILERVVEPLQQTDLRNTGKLLPESIEGRLDRLTMLEQQVELLLGITNRAASRVPILRTKDTVGSGGFDFLSNQGKNLDDPTEAQDAVTLSSLAGDLVQDAFIPLYTSYPLPDPDTSEYWIIRVRPPGSSMVYWFRCQKKDNSYTWVAGPRTFE